MRALFAPFLALFTYLRLSYQHRGSDPRAYRQIIVMRTDLKMRRGKEIAQGGHAVSAIMANHRRDPRVKAWLRGPFTKIAVSIDSEDALLALIAQAKEAGILVAPIVDAGRTEFHGVPTLTCAAFGPDLRTTLDPITGHLKLR